jgi:hypothetical protein
MTVLNVLIFTFLEANVKTKDFEVHVANIP